MRINQRFSHFLSPDRKIPRLRLGMTVLLFCFLFFSSQSFAFKLLVNVDAGARWAAMPIVFSLTPMSSTTSILDGSESIAIVKAMRSWTHIPGSFLRFLLSATVFPTTCANALAAGVNIICFLQSKADFQTLLGVAVSSATVALSGTTTLSQLSISGGFILLNEEDHIFRTDQFQPNDERRFDLESVILREFGHVAGLDSSLDPDAIMHPLTSPIFSQSRRVLHQDDIRGIQFLYPLSEVFPGISCGTIDKSSIYLTIGLFLIGFLWMAFRTRLRILLAS